MDSPCLLSKEGNRDGVNGEGEFIPASLLWIVQPRALIVCHLDPIPIFLFRFHPESHTNER